MLFDRLIGKWRVDRKPLEIAFGADFTRPK
jgi:hypothetical protein